jgi:hypothetical protein
LPRAAISGATSEVSGMLRQYFFGISLSIAPTLSRAGIEDRCVIGLPHRLERVAVGASARTAPGPFAQRLAVPVDAELWASGSTSACW